LTTCGGDAQAVANTHNINVAMRAWIAALMAVPFRSIADLSLDGTAVLSPGYPYLCVSNARRAALTCRVQA